MRLRHATLDPTIEVSPVISGVGDGRYKTTTLRLTGLAATRAIAGGFDFDVLAIEGDLTVAMVRLVR